MSDIHITVEGVGDITDDVILADAEFIAQASGSPGICRFRVKDALKHTFTVGSEIVLTIDGVRMWGGYLMQLSRQYFFPAELAVKPRDPCDPIEFTTAALLLEGVDYNILFRKRFIVSKTDPEDAVLRVWPQGTPDNDIIAYMVAHHLYLEGDGLDTSTMVEHVGTPNPDSKASPYGASYSWEQAMNAIAFLTGAIYYINPDKQLVYTDVDTPNAAYALGDAPSIVYTISAAEGEEYIINAPSGETLTDVTIPSESRVQVSGAVEVIGYREMEILNDGSKLTNDALVWGAGTGSTSVKFARVTDERSVADHGLWQIGDFREDMYKQTSVDHRATSIVYGSPQNKRGGKDDAIAVTVTVKVPYFRVAEKVLFTSNVFNFTDVIPIRRQRITFVSPTAALYQLTLSHFIDEPWNTVEYYLPPFGFRPPHIDIPLPPNPGDYPFCPMAPGYFAALVFSDNFHRAATSNTNLSYNGGVWYQGSTEAYWPISNNVGSPSSRTVHLGQTVGPISVLLAIDGTSGTHAVNVANMLTIDVNGHVTIYGLKLREPTSETQEFISYGLVTTEWDIDLSKLNKKYYLRYTEDSALGLIGYRIWPQDQPEHQYWDGYVSGATNATIAGPLVFNDRYSVFISSGSPVMGIDIWGANARFPGEEVGTLSSTNHDAWRMQLLRKPPDAYHGAVYVGAPGVNSADFARSSATVPSYSMVGRWPQFHPEQYAPYPATCNQESAAFYTGDDWLYPTQRDIMLNWPPPQNMLVSGEMNVYINNKGISNTSPEGGNFEESVAVDFIAFKSGIQPLDPHETYVPADHENEEPAAGGGLLWSMYGDYVGNGSWPGGTPHLGTNVGIEWAPFQFQLGLNSIAKGKLEWGCKFNDPEGAVALMGTAGYMGSFFLPNARTIGLRLRRIRYQAQWPILPHGHRFCLPQGANSVSTAMTKQCDIEEFDFVSTTKTRLYTSSFYMAGTLEVWLDGLQLRRNLDFVEDDPNAGTYIILTDLSTSHQVRACYFTETYPR